VSDCISSALASRSALGYTAYVNPHRIVSITSDRLDLISLSPDILEPLLAGNRSAASAILGLALPDAWPDEHEERFLRLRLKQMLERPETAVWLARAMVLRSEGRPMVGHIGFHGPPAIVGRAELGYTVFAPYRRRGFAREAALAMMAWAGREQGITQFFVSVSPENGPSLAMAASLGFVKIGEQMDDEDGLEHVFCLEGDRK
jgi:RimJ/RimL family protein N-acetyltransferase